ncbi:hypothetical protein RB195_005244 [Necator americanus]|uniref:RRM domain-containing protein n=1 Tax=Necator americanus TaxID=51031 RepID=A0ABR1BQ40_NECAM
MGADGKRKKRATVKNEPEDTLRQSKGLDAEAPEPSAKRFCLAVDAPKAFALVEKSRRTRTTDSRYKSCVVLVRGLPENAITADLIDSLSRFGSISYVKFHSKQGWAFVEFEDEEGAESCVKYGYDNALCICGNEVFMMYSLHHILDRDALERREPNKVIVMSVSNIQKEVKVQDVYNACSPFGTVERIKISPLSRGSETGLLVFVEFDTIEAAHEAKLAVNGAFFFEDCNLIHCEFASLNTLTVSENTDYCYDYIQSRRVKEYDLKSEKNSVPTPRLVPYDSSPDSVEDQTAMDVEAFATTKDPSPQHHRVPSPPSVNVKDELTEDYYLIDTCPTVTECLESVTAKNEAQNYEYVQWSCDMEPSLPSATLQTSPAEEAAQQITSVDVKLDVSSSASSVAFVIPAINPGSSDQLNSVHSINGSSTDVTYGENRRCMMVYGIDLKTGMFSCDRLFNLLCMYGHVIAIKLFMRKRDSAIVEFAHAHSVNTAMKMLHNINLFGCSLTFEFGRADSVRHTFERLPDGLPACEFYSSCPLQRFGRHTSTENCNKNRITSPTSMLFWWDAPPYTTKGMIYKMFQSVGAPQPTKVSPFSPRPSGSVGIAEFASTQQAAEALMLTNHFPMLLSGFRGPAIVKLTFAISKYQQAQNETAGAGRTRGLSKMLMCFQISIVSIMVTVAFDTFYDGPCDMEFRRRSHFNMN